MNRRGFTLIELLIVVVILGILAGVSVQGARMAKIRADAARIVSDFTAVRTAAMENYSASGLFPATGSWGQSPPEFATTLSAVDFQYGDVHYRWRRWSRPDGSPRGRSGGPLYGLDVRSGNATLLAAVRGTFKGVVIGGGNTVTLVIQ